VVALCMLGCASSEPTATGAPSIRRRRRLPRCRRRGRVYTPELPRGRRDAVTWIPGTRAAIVTRKDGFYPAHLR
jgi:hypothetical protein